MLKAPTCLHIPNLYEEGEALLSWEKVDDATGYRLECVFDEDFEAASHGLTWLDIRAENKTWDEIKELQLTWDDFRKLPTGGVTWNDIMFSGATWNDIASKEVTWNSMQRIPARFTIFAGEGETIPGPDMGWTWDDLRNSEMTWDAIKESGVTWRDISFLPPKSARGLSWDCFKALRLTWNDIASRGLTWDEWKNQSDASPHIAHNVNIPLYKKLVNYRVQAYNETETSEYADSGLIKLLPRSLKKYKPPCLHVPVLREDEPARIVWGDLYGAQGFVLERKFGADFETVYSGEGVKSDEPECAALEDISDASTHFRHDDRMPIGEKTVTYRAKAYNTTDESQYLTSDAVKIIPLFEREDSVSWAAVKDETYRLELMADNIRAFSTVVMNIDYPGAGLTLTDFAAQLPTVYTGVCVIPQIGLDILSHSDGRIRFRCNRSIPSGEEWSGVVTVLAFKAIKSGNVQIKLY